MHEDCSGRQALGLRCALNLYLVGRVAPWPTQNHGSLEMKQSNQWTLIFYLLHYRCSFDARLMGKA